MNFEKTTLWNSLSAILNDQPNKSLWASVVLLGLTQSVYAAPSTSAVNVGQTSAQSIIAETSPSSDFAQDVSQLKTAVNDAQFLEQFNLSEEQVEALSAEQISDETVPDDVSIQPIQIEDPTIQPIQSAQNDERAIEPRIQPVEEIQVLQQQENEPTTVTEATAQEDKPNFVRRLWNRFRSNTDGFIRQNNIRVDVRIAKIDATPVLTEVKPVRDNAPKSLIKRPDIDRAYNLARDLLEQNIKNHFSSINASALSQSASVKQQFEAQVQQAAEAVGFYQSEIELKPTPETGRLVVEITPKYLAYVAAPKNIKVVRHDCYLKHEDVDQIEACLNENNFKDPAPGLPWITPTFSKILEILPDIQEGDFLNHGAFETTRQRINDTAEEEGFFEGYWEYTALTDKYTIDEENIKKELDSLELEAIPNWETFDQHIEALDSIEFVRVNAKLDPLDETETTEQSALLPYPALANLVYVTGRRYDLGDVKFCTVEQADTFYKVEQEKAQAMGQAELDRTVKLCPDMAGQINTELPVDEDVLRNMVPWLLSTDNKDNLSKEVTWKRGKEYTSWRINNLTSSLAASRYFDKVEVVRTPDVYEVISTANALREQQEQSKQLELEKAASVETAQVTRAELNTDTTQASLSAEPSQDLKLPVDNVINVHVVVGADKRNTTDLGLGYGTDTGVRLRSQYRRSIVNSRGHSFESNLELAESRQSVDGRYLIPHHHSIYDYFSLVGGYEREDRSGVIDGQGLLIESAVAGIDHAYTNPTGIWQHTTGLRYRLDRITNDNPQVKDQRLDGFLHSGAEQQSLLFHFEASRADSDDSIKTTSGFKQTYKVELGAEGFLSDANIAKVNGQWLYLTSFGLDKKHQFIGEAEVGYIFTDNFAKVPYNLRYFAGGDQSLRGFDYKSLSPIEDGIKIGGQALARTSLEYNYEVRPNWRVAAFTDVGNAYDEKFKNETAYGAGLGVRWASPVGPMRIDVASGLSDENKPIRIHFFIGSQF